MNIGFDNMIFGLQPVGGISRYFVEVGNALVSQGEAVTCAPGLHINQHLHSAAFKVSGVYMKKYPKWLANKARRYNIRHADKVLARAGVQVVHETYHQPRPFERCKAPTVLTVHDMIHEIFTDEYSANNPVRLHRKAAADRAAQVICVSAGTRDDLVRLLGIAPEKITVVHHGISRFPQREAGDARSDGVPFLLYVGNRQGYKNFEGLLRAFAASGRLRKDLRIVAFGGGAASATEAKLLHALGLEVGTGAGQVGFTGGDDAALGGVLADAVALVYPSRYEGFGMPPLEAMHVGCPVVCSRASVMPEVLGDAPAYFDPDRVDDIQHTIEQVVFDSARREALATAGRARAALYSWERCARETLAVYQKAVSA